MVHHSRLPSALFQQLQKLWWEWILSRRGCRFPMEEGCVVHWRWDDEDENDGYLNVRKGDYLKILYAGTVGEEKGWAYGRKRVRIDYKMEWAYGWIPGWVIISKADALS